MSVNPGFRLPWHLVALDAFGALLLVLGILGAVGLNIGLPVLADTWPFLVALGVVLMAPLIVWVLRQARQRGNR